MDTLARALAAYHRTRDDAALGRDICERHQYSEETVRLIDREVRHLVEEGRARASRILTEHRLVLDRVADALVQRETVDGPTFEALVGDAAPPAPRPPPAAPAALARM
jgi:cell division protease FtsH